MRPEVGPENDSKFLRDKRRDPEFHRNLWLYYRFPEKRKRYSDEESALFQKKVERCRRITEKWPRLLKEHQASRLRRFGAEGVGTVLWRGEERCKRR